MIVVDASVVLELLLNREKAGSIRQSLLAAETCLVAPHLLDVEILSALRRITAPKGLDAYTSGSILRELRNLPVNRFSHEPLLERIWELRKNFTSYDAAYIALAEILGAALYTCDEKLLRGHKARIVLF